MNPFFLNGGQPLLDLEAVDLENAQYAGNPAKLDLVGISPYDFDSLVLSARASTIVGTPGTVSVHFAFHHEELTPAAAAAQLWHSRHTITLDLTADAPATTIRNAVSERIPIVARYLYVWWGCQANAANDAVDLEVWAHAARGSGSQADGLSQRPMKGVLDLPNIIDFGWSTAEAQNPVRLDLQDNDSGRVPDAIALIGRTTNGQGATPTSPGPAKAWRVQYAFSDHAIAAANAPGQLQTRATNLDCSLPDSSDPDVREHATGRIVVTGRYLYVWWFQTGWNAFEAEVHGEVFFKALI